MHAPAMQASLCVQASPSLHEAPSSAFGFEHIPVAGLQVPATWHSSIATHETGLPPEQLPAWQPSVWVHGSPSSHVVPFSASVVTFTPLSHEFSVHWSPFVLDVGVVRNAFDAAFAIALVFAAITAGLRGDRHALHLGHVQLQRPVLHARTWQSVSCPGQSAAWRHSTHARLPSQRSAPPNTHAVPAAFGSVPQVLFTQVRSKHSAGTLQSVGVVHDVPAAPPVPLNWMSSYARKSAHPPRTARSHSSADHSIVLPNIRTLTSCHEVDAPWAHVVPAERILTFANARRAPFGRRR